MPDLIRLLPDSVANQIAAGEVIQRPASAVKEILENAIDAGATQVKLNIKDAGKTLIQVIDNGIGMSETDARMCFERHATSKIKQADDLFAIRTLGFRGEALASVAAIAHIELKTRRAEDEVGTCVVIEGSKVKSQEPVSCQQGTTLSIRNLFYNVPARRYFLKTDTVEFRHIIEEFQRVALVHPGIELSLYHNEKPVFQLIKGNIKQRIVHVFGSQMNEKLLPVELKTELASISGFIGKPESARKTRGEQYFFANGRFIRHPYFHHAVEQAFQELIPETSIPSYFLFIDVDPAAIDINIHPTKTEVNFQHSQLIYASVRSAVKHSLGLFSLSPQLDFDREESFDIHTPAGYKPEQPSILIDPDYNPFRNPQNALKPGAGITANRENWEKMFDGLERRMPASEHAEVQQVIAGSDEQASTTLNDAGKLFQVQNRFIVANVKSGLMVIDQQKAHQRILFEKVSENAAGRQVAAQRIISLKTMQFSPMDAAILYELKNDLDELGFEIADLGNGTFALNSVPANMPLGEIEGFIDSLIEDFKSEKADANTDRKVRLARLIAGTMAIKPGKILKQEEMQLIIDQLFACQVPDTAPDGSRILKILQVSDIEKLLRS